MQATLLVCALEREPSIRESILQPNAQLLPRSTARTRTHVRSAIGAFAAFGRAGNHFPYLPAYAAGVLELPIGHSAPPSPSRSARVLCTTRRTSRVSSCRFSACAQTFQLNMARTGSDSSYQLGG